MAGRQPLRKLQASEPFAVGVSVYSPTRLPEVFLHQTFDEFLLDKEPRCSLGLGLGVTDNRTCVWPGYRHAQPATPCGRRQPETSLLARPNYHYRLRSPFLPGRFALPARLLRSKPRYLRSARDSPRRAVDNLPLSQSGQLLRAELLGNLQSQCKRGIHHRPYIQARVPGPE